MVNVQSEIDQIRNNSLSSAELLRCLDSSLLLVRANSIVNIVQRRLAERPLIDKLSQIGEQNDSRRLMGTLTCGRLAIAALYWLDTSESRHKYDEIRKTLNADEVCYLDDLISEGPPMLA